MNNLSDIDKSGIPVSATSLSRMTSYKSRNAVNIAEPSASQSELFNKQFYFTEKFMNMKSPVMNYHRKEPTPSKHSGQEAQEKANDDSFFYKR